MWSAGRRGLSLRGKLLGMMFGLLMLVLATLFLLYWRAETQLIAQVERHTTDLSTAIQISVEQLTSTGQTSEARLQDYVQQLQRRGVREISIVSNEEEVIASSNPRRVGIRVDPKRKDLLITARLGEEIAGSRAQKTYNLFVPVVVSDQRSGYVLISMILDDFAELARINLLKRLIATVLVFGVGSGGAVVLAWTYAKPISRVVEAARRVAQGRLEERLPDTRRDEIGELNRSFNEMVERLRERTELEARLHQAERLSAIAHLASGIAHEVRNPLNLINLSIDHLRSRFAPAAASDREEFKHLTDSIKEEVHRLNDMIETFLKYGKPLTLQRRPADIRTLLDEVLGVAAQKAEAQHVQVIREYADDLPAIWVDTAHLKTCFLNLVLNAFQAMPGGGALTLRLRREEQGSRGAEAQGSSGAEGPRGGTRPAAKDEREVGMGPRVGDDEQGGGGAGEQGSESVAPQRPSPSAPLHVVVEVEDTGVGIAPGDLPRVFEPYFTTKEVGIGLGLALTKKILEEHGAHIELASEVGKGTLVRLHIPAGGPGA